MVVVGASGIVLGAWYLLTMLMRVFFGPVKEPLGGAEHGPPVEDLNLRELSALIPIAVLCVAIGVYPQPVLDTVEKEIQLIAHYAAQARERQANNRLSGIGADDLRPGTRSLPPKSLDDRLLPTKPDLRKRNESEDRFIPPRKERPEDKP
jgi:hypothetical protein